MDKFKRVVCCSVLIIITFTLFVSGYQSSESEILDKLEKCIPEEYKSYITYDSESAYDIQKDISNEYNIGFFFKFIIKALGEILLPAVKDFALLLGIVMTSSVLNMSRDLLNRNSVSVAYEYSSMLVITLITFRIISGILTATDTYLKTLNNFISGLIPIVSTLYTATGNLSSAAVNTLGLQLSLGFIESFEYYILFPMIKIILIFVIFSAFSMGIDLTKISSAIKNFFTIGLVCITTVFSTILGYQSSLAAGADNFVAKTVKFASNSFIPVVGGPLSETVSTVISGLSLVKSTVGVIAIIIILLMFLPVITMLVTYKFCFVIISAVAGIIGCDKESSFFEGISGVIGFAMAVVCSISVIFFLDVALLVKNVYSL